MQLRYWVLFAVLLCYSGVKAQWNLTQLPKGWWYIDKIVGRDSTWRSLNDEYIAIITEKSDPCGNSGGIFYVLGRKVYVRDRGKKKYSIHYNSCPDYFHIKKVLGKCIYNVAFCTNNGKYDMDLRFLSRNSFCLKGYHPLYDEVVTIYYKKEKNIK